jgi:TRAP-type mannitol/chloroaromatic compound transport system permease large subunit
LAGRRPRVAGDEIAFRFSKRNCYFFVMPEEQDSGAEALARALELKLAQKRLHWQRAREKYRTLRVLSFAFLFIVILVGLIAFFFFFSHTNEMREQSLQSPPATESPH